MEKRLQPSPLRLISIEGPIWRLLAAHLADEPTVLARAPEGRFHHSGQAAVYASLSAEGASVAIRRYLADGIPRLLVPMRLNAAIVANVRGDPLASVVWQDQRATLKMTSTWAISDAARQAGARRCNIRHARDPNCLTSPSSTLLVSSQLALHSQC